MYGSVYSNATKNHDFNVTTRLIQENNGKNYTTRIEFVERRTKQGLVFIQKKLTEKKYRASHNTQPYKRIKR